MSAARRIWLLGVLAALVVAAPSWASAGAATKVFPLSSGKPMPAALEGTPDQLTRAIAAMVGGTVADSSITAAATALGCTIDDSDCLDRLARMHRVTEIVFGTIRVSDDQRVFVKLTRFISGTERRERTFVLTSGSAPALARQLARSSRDMFDLPPARASRSEDAERDPDADDPEAPPPKDRPARARGPKKARLALDRDPADPAPERLDTPDELPGGADRGDDRGDEPAPRRGVVTTGTYALVGGGLVGVTVGTGLLIAGWALHDDIERAPRNTTADFQRLTALERAARERTLAGGALLLVGGGVVVGGVVRAVLQRQRSAEPAGTDRQARSLRLIPTERGAALILSGRFP